MTPAEKDTLVASFEVKHEDFSIAIALKEAAYTSAIDQYGLDGYLAALTHKLTHFLGHGKLTVFHYRNAPENPWSFIDTLNLENAIDAIWKNYPVPFVNTFKKHCTEIFVVQKKEKWFLLYAYKGLTLDKKPSYDFLAGQAPETKPTLAEELINLGWKMPTDLQQLYSIHHGFGDINSVLRSDNAFAIVPAEKLDPWMNELEEVARENEWEVNYHFYDLLPFLGDGAGNYQCFYKTEPTETGSYYTVDWDHETKEISGRKTLAEFMEYEFGNTLKGR